MTAGQVAVVAGASCALGREVVRRLASAHAMRVACVSRHALLENIPDGCGTYQADITHSAQCDRLFRQVHAELGPVALLINCAGANVNKLHLRCTDEDYALVMDTNVRGALSLTRAALRHGGLLSAASGSVVHIGSVVGRTGNEGQVLYAASKAALSGAVRAWAKEYGARQIRFNVVAPGLMEGEGMAAALTPAQRARWCDECALGRLASVAEVADVVLAVAFARYMTGQTVYVDGGQR